MIDCLGIEIEVGDLVAIGSYWDGTIEWGFLDHDPYDPKYKKLRFRKPDSDYTFVMDRKSFRLINMTAYVKNNYANKEVVGDFWLP